MSKKLSVSMMCVDYGNLNRTLEIFSDKGVDYLHIDIMDGRFVPNLMLGTAYVEWLRGHTQIPLDFHFMVEDAAAKLEWFPICKGDLVTVHVESSWSILNTLMAIREIGAKAVLAVGPQTPITSIVHLLNYIDGVCVMLVIPGFSGQSMIKGMEDKIHFLADYRMKNRDDFFIEVDGHVHKDNIKMLGDAGADIFVAGTSLLGRDPSNYAERIQLFYNTFD